MTTPFLDHLRESLQWSRQDIADAILNAQRLAETETEPLLRLQYGLLRDTLQGLAKILDTVAEALEPITPTE